MRDNNLDTQSFISQLELMMKKYSEIFFRSSASDNPKWCDSRFENLVGTKTRKLDDLVVLAIFSYYIPEEVGVLLRFELEEIMEQNPEMDLLYFLLQGKGAMLCYLIETNRWSTRDFFGNIVSKNRLSNLKHLFFLRFRPYKPKIKRVQRHRGYRDKGTLRNIHEYHSFVSYTAEMNQIEEERIVRKDTLALLQGFLE